MVVSFRFLSFAHQDSEWRCGWGGTKNGESEKRKRGVERGEIAKEARPRHNFMLDFSKRKL